MLLEKIPLDLPRAVVLVDLKQKRRFEQSFTLSLTTPRFVYWTHRLGAYAIERYR